ncbi:MAG: SdpI family protein [Lachnospiraceae bacterium]|nr:SdpI family protein [Lachnospiraceae bacterium]
MQGILVVLLIVPLITLIVGLIGKKKPKRDINGTVGYRSRRSKSSQEAWDYAQKVMADFLLKCALITFIIGIIGGVAALGKDLNTQVICVVIAIVIQTLALVLIIPLTEDKLKKKFGD